MSGRQRVALLGATGSIGTSTLSVLDHHADRFELVSVAAKSSWQKVAEIVRKYDLQKAVMWDAEAAEKLRAATGIEVLSGTEGLVEMTTAPDVDVVVNGLVGSIGCLPTLRAVEADKKVALANKESLVMSGEVVNAALDAHPAVRRTGDCRKRGVLHEDLLRIGDLAQPFRNQWHGDAPQIKALAPRNDGRQHLMGLGGRKEELHVGRRLLKRLEQGIPRARREHVHFVDDVDLVAAFRRRILDLVADRAHVIHTIVRRAVYLQHIQRVPCRNLTAILAFAARLSILEIQAVERLGEDAGGGGLANPARTHEQVRMTNPVCLDGVLQGPGNMLLPHDFGESLRAPFASKHLICHKIIY